MKIGHRSIKVKLILNKSKILGKESVHKMHFHSPKSFIPCFKGNPLPKHIFPYESFILLRVNKIFHG